jgi:hypothetical protein
MERKAILSLRDVLFVVGASRDTLFSQESAAAERRGLTDSEHRSDRFIHAEVDIVIKSA